MTQIRFDRNELPWHTSMSQLTAGELPDDAPVYSRPWVRTAVLRISHNTYRVIFRRHHARSAP